MYTPYGHICHKHEGLKFIVLECFLVNCNMVFLFYRIFFHIMYFYAFTITAFMYQKQNQFLNSPYFSKESNISQDLDKFYKDLTKKDFFSNLGKYTSIILGVLKEKYFAVVPFGKS